MATCKSLIFFVLSISFWVRAECAEKPLNMPSCASTDSTCLCRAAEAGLKYLKTPRAALRLPSDDPLLIKRIHVSPNRRSRVCYAQDYYNMEFIGYSDGVVTNFATVVNRTHVYLNFSVYMATFNMVSTYKWNGTVLGYPVDGYGRCNITSVNVTHVHMITLKRQPKNRLAVIDYEMDLLPTALLFDLPNLVKGDPEATEETVQLFNDHGMQIFHELSGDYDRVFASVFFPYACAFFKGVKLDDLFLDCKPS